MQFIELLVRIAITNMMIVVMNMMLISLELMMLICAEDKHKLTCAGCENRIGAIVAV